MISNVSQERMLRGSNSLLRDRCVKWVVEHRASWAGVVSVHKASGAGRAYCLLWGTEGRPCGWRLHTHLFETRTQRQAGARQVGMEAHEWCWAGDTGPDDSGGFWRGDWKGQVRIKRPVRRLLGVGVCARACALVWQMAGDGEMNWRHNVLVALIATGDWGSGSEWQRGDIWMKVLSDSTFQTFLHSPSLRFISP